MRLFTSASVLQTYQNCCYLTTDCLVSAFGTIKCFPETILLVVLEKTLIRLSASVMHLVENVTHSCIEGIAVHQSLLCAHSSEHRKPV